MSQRVNTQNLIEEPPGQETFTELSATKQKIVKSCVILILIGVFVSVHIFPSMTLEKVDCIDDFAHDYTNSINQYFTQNVEVKNSMMIVCALISDICVVALFSIWTIYGCSWRLPIAVSGTYLLKVMLSALFKMRYPENMIWDFPGWYSLSVSYGAANDTHFTVHVALLLIVCLEFHAMRHRVLMAVSIVALLFQTFLMLVLRGAYSIDLFAAFVFGYFFWLIGQQFSYLIDVDVFGLTFQERFPHFQTECGNCKHPINKWTKNSVQDMKQAVAEQYK